MNIRQLINEDDSAVSPVIGVILMVAITVILAAVIASFVLGMGPNTAQTPTASFSSEVDSSGADDVLVITMDSGEALNPSQLSVSGDNDGDISWDGDDSDSEITAGETAEVTIDSTVTSYEITLIYESGDTTSTMQTFEGTV